MRSLRIIANHLFVIVATTELNRALPIGDLMSPSWAILLEASGGQRLQDGVCVTVGALTT